MTHCHSYHKREKSKKSREIENTSSLILTGILLAAVAGAGLWFLKDRPTASLTDAAAGGGSVVVDPKAINLGTVEMSKGVVERTFAVRNEGSGVLRIANLQTSCMCTSARLEIGGKASPIFGMAGHSGGHHGGVGAAPRSWSMEVPPGGEGTLRVYYDPNAHGPAGVGPFERMISFTTNDAEHERVEVTIRGTVVK